MDNNFENGNTNFMISIFLGVVAFIGENIEIVIRGALAVGSLTTTVMACRNFYYSTKLNKEKLKKEEKDG